MEKILGIDIGTTAIKFVLTEHEQILFSEKCPVATSNSGAAAVWQDPEAIWQLVKKGIAAAVNTGYQIEALAFSSAMHSLVPIEEGKAPKAYIWSDQQAAQTIKAFKTTALAPLFYQKTGTPLHAMSPFAKLLYFKEQNPKRYQATVKWADIKSYVLKKLTGDWLLDYSVASATGLFNSEKLCWDEEILAYLELPALKLPAVYDTTNAVKLQPSVCRQLGLSAHTSVILGASDGCLASWASYLAVGSPISLTVGTSGAIRQLSSTRHLTPDGMTFCYYLKKGLWVSGGPTNNGGKVLTWLSQLLYQNDTAIFEQIDRALTASPIGARELVFLPYVFGERAPFWDSEKTAAFSGLKLWHQQPDLIRSVLEGLLFNLRLIADALALKDEPLAISGGFFDLPSAPQLLADIFQKTCIKAAANEPAVGAALLQENGIAPQAAVRIVPHAEAAEEYAAAYQRFKAALKTT